MPEEPIRILHLIHTMAYGGVETAVLNWLRNLDPARFEVHLACFANPGNTEGHFIAAAERAGFHVHRIPWSRRKPLFKAARALAGLVREHRADIIHSHNWYADFVTVIAARLVRVRTVTTLYVWFDYDWKRNILQKLDEWAIRGFDRITAHCESTRNGTIARGIDPRRVSTLICGFETHRIELDAAERQRRRAERGVLPGETVLVNVARLYPEKAHDFLLDCFADILRRRPECRLWIAGIGPLEAEVRAHCTALGLDQRVDFLGFVTELPELLALADLQVHPAHIEGVPLAVCEGMAAGLPIVASAVGGLPEILDHGRNGVLVPPGDRPAYVQAVVELLEQGERARELGRSARRFIENEYSLTTAVRAVENTYREMMA